MPQTRRQYILLAILIAAVLFGAVYIERQSAFQPAAAPTAAPAAASESQAAAPVVVYISGYVVRPGVYRLEGEPRAIDGVNAAGGFATGADPTKINLAQKLTDGMQINVPGAMTPAAGGTAGGAAANAKVSINNADKKQLESLPGIGPALAERILEHRKTQGSFMTLEDLKKVPGIGDAKYNALKEKIAL